MLHFLDLRKLKNYENRIGEYDKKRFRETRF
jgi:hypothetical protein